MNIIKQVLGGLLALLLTSLVYGKDIRVYMGSGFFINQMGYIATAKHLAIHEGIMAVEYKGHLYKADVVAISPNSDSAIIKIHVANEYAFKLEDDKQTQVFILGYPVTHDQITLSAAHYRGIEGRFVYLTSDRAVVACGGNSGGPAFDMRGNALGVLVVTMNTSDPNKCSNQAGATPIDKVIDLARLNHVVLIPSLQSDLVSTSQVFSDIIRGNGVVKILIIPKNLIKSHDKT